MYWVLVVYEEGGEWVFLVNIEVFVGMDGCVSVLWVYEVIMLDGKFVKVEGFDFEFEVDLVLLVMGFVGLEWVGLLIDFGVKFIEYGNVVCGDDFDILVFGVFVVGDMGWGQLLIVWVIVEGWVVVVVVDWYLMGFSVLLVFVKLIVVLF